MCVGWIGLVCNRGWEDIVRIVWLNLLLLVIILILIVGFGLGFGVGVRLSIQLDRFCNGLVPPFCLFILLLLLLLLLLVHTNARWRSKRKQSGGDATFVFRLPFGHFQFALQISPLGCALVSTTTEFERSVSGQVELGRLLRKVRFGLASLGRVKIGSMCRRHGCTSTPAPRLHKGDGQMSQSVWPRLEAGSKGNPNRARCVWVCVPLCCHTEQGRGQSLSAKGGLAGK